ncbi:MAG: hypothetical protein QOC99_3813 [Acidobacteriota bacterium]|jgi:hypothetical protein|nr:hypothetical protein [Acidobacteriota bacterium]MDT7781301.1 hypothetical protein [Acidobacteriota bacterium]
MAEPKIKPAKREAGKSKFRLPERVPRPVEENPLRELLKEAKAQEAALEPKASKSSHTPAKKIAGVQRPSAGKSVDTPAIPRAEMVPVNTEASLDQDSVDTFAEFSKRWSPVLRSGQMGVCRALFEMTYEMGQAECFTSMPRLAEAAGIKERQCYNVVGQLEVLGFVERPDIFNTPTQKGTVFRLYMEPRPLAARAERRYHIGGKGQE